MMQDNEQDQRGQSRETDRKMENNGGRDEPKPERDSLLHTVREFLKQEEQTYGRFQIPELPDVPPVSSTTGIPAQSGEEKAPPATDRGRNQEVSVAGARGLQDTAVSRVNDLESEVPGEDKEMDTDKDAGTGVGTDVRYGIGAGGAVGRSQSGDAYEGRSQSGDDHGGVGGAGPAAAKSLEELFEFCLAADVLRTDLADTRLVFGTGNPNAGLMLIGEAPGVQEDKQGEPFVGKAGQLLNKILAAISFQREDVYIANILKHRPPNNRDPLPEERDRSLPYLYRQIELIQPKLILCLGRVSAQTLLNTSEPMKNLRSRFHPFHNGIELLVTFHPAALLRNPAWKRDTWEDVQLLRKRYDELTGTSR